MKKSKLIKLAMVAALFHGVTASAQTYNYAPGDLLAAFGRSGSSQDVIVDLGSASLYQNATVLDNQIISVANTLNVGGDPVSFTVGVGSLFDYNGTWSPNVKNQTPIG